MDRVEFAERNVWRVQWVDLDGNLKFKKFRKIRPRKAVEFAKALKLRGFSVDVISQRRAFPPPAKQLEPPNLGMIWCPYCIKWRNFEEAAVWHDWGLGPVALRCPTCTISIRDAYVRMYNPTLVVRAEIEMELKERQRKMKKEQNMKGKENPFGRKVRTIRR